MATDVSFFVSQNNQQMTCRFRESHLQQNERSKRKAQFEWIKVSKVMMRENQTQGREQDQEEEYS